MNLEKERKSMQRCISFCTADSYDILGISNYFRKKGYLTRLSKDFLHVTKTKSSGDIFFFNHGCFVCWGYRKSFEDRLVEIVKSFSRECLQTIEVDHFSFCIGSKTSIDSHERLKVDIISLESSDPQIKLAMSYGLAQSIKLEAFEEAVQLAIKKNNHLPQEIATRGIISLSRRAIFKRIGEIFIARSSININIEFLDAPEFFWRNPNLEPFYIMTKKFLDISSRVMALNQKLDLLQELLDILNGQVQHRYSSLLESIIILLIVVEIIISLFQFHVV